MQILQNRRGLFRLWVVLSVAWLASIAFFYEATPDYAEWPDRCETLKPKVEDFFNAREDCFEDKANAQNRKFQVMFSALALAGNLAGGDLGVERVLQAA